MRLSHSSFSLAAVLLLAMLVGGACKRTKYICPAYQSAFVLDMPTYKRNATQDSLALAADTSADIDVIAVLAERIKKDPISQYEYDADSVPKFADNGVIKTDVLLLRKISRRRKDKVMASVPMITVFPESTDSTKGEEGEEPKSKAVPAADPEENTGSEEPDKPVQETAPAPKKEKEDSTPF